MTERTITYIGSDNERRVKKIKSTDIIRITGEHGPVVAGLILNQQLGATILASPCIFVDSGIIMSLVLSIVMCLISYYCSIGIIEIDVNERGCKLSDLYKKYMNNFGRFSYDVFNLCLLWPVLIGYIVLLGDLLIPCFEICGITVSTKVGRGIVIVLGATIIIFITVTYRNAQPRIRRLNLPDRFGKFISVETFLTCCWFLLVLFINASIYFARHHSIEPTCQVFKVNIRIFNSISIYSLCYALPSVFLSKIQLYTINRDDNKEIIKRRKIVTLGGIFLVFLFMTIPASMGYLFLGENTDGNVLNNFANNDALIVIMRIAYTVSITGSYVFISETVNEMFLDLFSACGHQENQSEGEVDLSENQTQDLEEQYMQNTPQVSRTSSHQAPDQNSPQVSRTGSILAGNENSLQNSTEQSPLITPANSREITNENSQLENTNNNDDQGIFSSNKTDVRAILAFIISTILPVVFATIFPEVKPVLGIAGSLGGCMVDFTLPSALYFVYRRKVDNSTVIQKILCAFCFVFGFVSAVIATWQAILGAIDSFKK